MSTEKVTIKFLCSFCKNKKETHLYIHINRTKKRVYRKENRILCVFCVFCVFCFRRCFVRTFLFFYFRRYLALQFFFVVNVVNFYLACSVKLFLLLNILFFILLFYRSNLWNWYNSGEVNSIGQATTFGKIKNKETTFTRCHFSVYLHRVKK